MNITCQPMGMLQTNCYIIENDGKEIIIDPGIEATNWVLANVENPIAILNTHGHFDHVWSNAELKEKLNIPIYVPIDDAFMLKDDPFGQGTPSSQADVLVTGDQEFDIAGLKITYMHFPGHTPGCSAILIENSLFSGDFIFKGSIGRVDFPYSSPEDMKKSIQKLLHVEENWIVYPGHGESTTVFAEKQVLPMWINMI
ncbi:MBL fold metallo-hydrolase [Sulfurospirillum arcachonense]|uniref:MBL fold metallo-hydrolase n=1 Tax=Sulfurospirillum arcachonense TaxID=57666 RepID=UPI000468D17D|nr:MBL fold metallo-hydrolase [Sulfurospirillum arcachonense]